MGFLDKLLGRGKEMAGKGMNVAEDVVDRAGDVAEKAIDKAEDKLGLGDENETQPNAPGAGSGSGT